MSTPIETMCDENQEQNIQASNEVTIVINNVAGLSPENGKLDSILKWMKEQDADILLCQETKISRFHKAMITMLRSWRFRRARVIISELPAESPNRYKPGGTMNLSKGKIATRIVETINDPIGRWAGFVYQLKNGVKLAIISVYQVPVSHDKSPTTNYAQQQAWLVSQNRGEENPRQGFKRDLIRMVKECQQREIEILLAGDLNEFKKDRGVLLELSITGKLFDVWQGKTPEQSFKHGRRCIDHAYASEKVF